jgi:hypothetical protein
MGPWYSGNTSPLQGEAASSILAGSTKKNTSPNEVFFVGADENRTPRRGREESISSRVGDYSEPRVLKEERSDDEF